MQPYWNNKTHLLLAEDKALVSLLEPLDSVGLLDVVGQANLGNSAMALSNTEARASKDNVEVHAENARLRVILDAEIDVLVNAKAKVAVVREVLSLQLELLHLQTLVQDLSSLLAANGAVDGNLLVTTDTESTDGVASWAHPVSSRRGAGDKGTNNHTPRVHGGLASQLLQNLGSASQTISGLTHANVHNDLLNLQTAHLVLRFLLLDHSRLLQQLLGDDKASGLRDLGGLRGLHLNLGLLSLQHCKVTCKKQFPGCKRNPDKIEKNLLAGVLASVLGLAGILLSGILGLAGILASILGLAGILLTGVLASVLRLRSLGTAISFTVQKLNI